MCEANLSQSTAPSLVTSTLSKRSPYWKNEAIQFQTNTINQIELKEISQIWEITLIECERAMHAYIQKGWIQSLLKTFLTSV